MYNNLLFYQILLKGLSLILVINLRLSLSD